MGSARPLAAVYARKLEDLPGDAPELSAAPLEG
jgi:hypothetical protein